MKRYLVVLSVVLAATVGVGTALSAHHSFAATYHEGQSITIEGELVQFLFRNPHSFVHINVTEKDGTVRRHAAEWGGASQLGGQGVNAQTLKVGDRVVITGSPARGYPKVPQVRLVTIKSTGLDWGRKPGETVD